MEQTCENINPSKILILFRKLYWFWKQSKEPNISVDLNNKLLIDTYRIKLTKSINFKSWQKNKLTGRARYGWTALVVIFLYYAIFSNRFNERTYSENLRNDDHDFKKAWFLILPQKAHKHLVVTCTVETRLICDYLVSLIVVPILIIAAWKWK